MYHSTIRKLWVRVFYVDNLPNLFSYNYEVNSFHGGQKQEESNPSSGKKSDKIRQNLKKKLIRRFCMNRSEFFYISLHYNNVVLIYS